MILSLIHALLCCTEIWLDLHLWFEDAICVNYLMTIWTDTLSAQCTAVLQPLIPMALAFGHLSSLSSSYSSLTVHPFNNVWWNCMYININPESWYCQNHWRPKCFWDMFCGGGVRSWQQSFFEQDSLPGAVASDLGRNDHSVQYSWGVCWLLQQPPCRASNNKNWEYSLLAQHYTSCFKDHPDIKDLKIYFDWLCHAIPTSITLCGSWCHTCDLHCLNCCNHGGIHECKTDHKGPQPSTFLEQHKSPMSPEVPVCELRWVNGTKGKWNSLDNSSTAGHAGNHLYVCSPELALDVDLYQGVCQLSWGWWVGAETVRFPLLTVHLYIYMNIKCMWKCTIGVTCGSPIGK